MIGTSFGPYRIAALLGRGGMGEVYRAVDTGQDGREVALKVIPPALSADPQFAARFRREAEIAAGLSDPHVVPIHRYGEIDGRLFLDMQLIEGRELADVLSGEGPLDPPRAVAVLEQVGGALDAAHADGLVHRDVKPSNILLTAPGPGRPEFAYLADFGIARATEPGSRTALTRTGAVVGTLAYMAPERFLAREAGPASDVYALACVLHELLSGSRPYPGTGYAAQVVGHLEQPPPRPGLQPGVPAAFDSVVARGMAKDPAARYPTAGALAAASRDALAGKTDPRGAAVAARGAPTVTDEPASPTWMPAPAPPWNPAAPSGAQAAPPGSRRVALLAAVALVVALVVAVPTTLWLVTRPAADPPVVVADPPAAVDAVPSGAPITERTLVGMAPAIGAPVLADLDGVPVLVTNTTVDVHVLDLATGEPIGQPIGAGPMAAATVTRLDGRSVVITSSTDRMIRFWDLASGDPLPTTLAGHTDAVLALAVADVDGRKILISSGADQTVRRWDLGTGAPVGEPFTGLGGRVDTLSVIRSGGRSVVLAKAFQTPIHAWDLVTGEPVGGPVPSRQDTIPTVELPGGTAVLSDDYDRVALVDLRSGAPLGGYDRLGAEDYGSVRTVAVVEGRTLIVTGDQERIQLRDPGTGRPVTSPLTGHEDMISSLAVLTAGGSTYLVSAGYDRSLRIWDLSTRMRG